MPDLAEYNRRVEPLWLVDDPQAWPPNIEGAGKVSDLLGELAEAWGTDRLEAIVNGLTAQVPLVVAELHRRGVEMTDAVAWLREQMEREAGKGEGAQADTPTTP